MGGWRRILGFGVVIVVGAGGALAWILTRSFPQEPWPPAEASFQGWSPEEGWSALYRADPPSEEPILSPFHLVSDPIGALLLANVEGDPDEIYLGFEPQWFTGGWAGEGMVVLGWRTDGLVDVFHESGIQLDPELYRITGEGMHRMAEREFRPRTLEFGPAGVHMDLGFHDLEGRRVELFVRETHPRPRRPFGLLAPVGGAAVRPPALPMVLLRDFDFVRRRGTEIRLAIDGREHAPDPLAFPMSGARVWFWRYSPRSVVVRMNPEDRVLVEPVVPLGVDRPTWSGSSQGTRVDGVVGPHGRVELHRFSVETGGDTVAVELHPPLPHLTAMGTGTRSQGRFRIASHPSLGTVDGEWSVVAEDEGRIRMELIPSGGWSPGPAPRSANFLFRVVDLFRGWPATYRWEAVLEPASADAGGAFTLDARWIRTGGDPPPNPTSHQVPDG
ncbi:MAG: hypothetical protein EA422_11645 [Gemmatimonadales bacterium]|nr:MAG: hypothetical protein EA422_11645 [Gemmatimonadales bacterium]